jgi:hypothetical protein
MTSQSARSCVGCAAVAALAALGACSSPTEPSFPSITGAYGGLAPAGAPFNSPVQFDITYRATDGTDTRVAAQGVFVIATQSGSGWTGEARRQGFVAGAVTGEVAMDGAIQFSMSQPQWGDCATTDLVPYSGYARDGSLYATGRGSVQCDDGTVLEIEESFHGRLPEPPPSPG